MVAKLVAEEGTLKGLVLTLENGNQWVIGRDPDQCQLLIEDPATSRRQLLATETHEGITVENLSETNPVAVNDEELVEPRLLQDGDTLRLGNSIYRFHVDLTPKQDIAMPTSDNDIPAEAAQEEEIPTPAIESEPDDSPHDSIFEDEDKVPEKDKQIAQINFDMMDSRWLLKVMGGPNNGAEFSMHAGESYIIGTDPNTCDIVFHDTSVSRQHVKIFINEEDQIFIEDLKSRNGTLVDGNKSDGRQPLNPNTVVNIGTSSFVIYDRDGNMQTIISPLLPSIVKVLQKEESKDETPKPIVEAPVEPVVIPEKKPVGPFLIIAALTGLFVITGIQLSSLFTEAPVVSEQPANTENQLAEALAPFPSVKYSYNKATGRLLLVGHVLTASDRNQLNYNLQGLSFIKGLDDSGIIIDEFVWKEMNSILARNPAWRSIAIQSPAAGQFVMTGYLQTRKQAEALNEYITNNFNYLDRLETRVIVDEDVVNGVVSSLEKQGIRGMKVSFENGELAISGGIPAGKKEAYGELVKEFQSIPGVRSVRGSVNELATAESMINISDRYEVSGFSKLGTTLSVVINGRIVGKGDIIDGMQIKDITPSTIFLEKDGVSYRIDYR